MKHYTLDTIGNIKAKDGRFWIEVGEEYRAAMTGLEGFSHLQVLWWADGCDNKEGSGNRQEQKPYKHAPDELGVFATRSPMRPNPIGVTSVYVLSVDEGTGVIELEYIDADDRTPLLDIKPYTPSVDRVEAPAVPSWCRHWPGCVEESGEFDWEKEFLF